MDDSSIDELFEEVDSIPEDDNCDCKDKSPVSEVKIEVVIPFELVAFNVEEEDESPLILQNVGGVIKCIEDGDCSLVIAVGGVTFGEL